MPNDSGIYHLNYVSRPTPDHRIVQDEAGHWVKADLKGESWRYSLCQECARYDECKLAGAVRKVEYEQELILPVWSCKRFEPLRKG